MVLLSPEQPWLASVCLSSLSVVTGAMLIHHAIPLTPPSGTQCFPVAACPLGKAPTELAAEPAAAKQAEKGMGSTCSLQGTLLAHQHLDSVLPKLHCQQHPPHWPRPATVFVCKPITASSLPLAPPMVVPPLQQLPPTRLTFSESLLVCTVESKSTQL